MKAVHFFAAAVVAALLAFQGAQAADGPGYSFSQGATVNGQKQEFSSGISLSGFDADGIAYRIYQTMHMLNPPQNGDWWKRPDALPAWVMYAVRYNGIPGRMLAGAKPLDAPDVVDLYRQALVAYLNAPGVAPITDGAGNVSGAYLWGVLPVMWAVDAYRAGALDKDTYLYNVERCEPAVQPGGEGGEDGAMFAQRQLACLVSSYLVAYGTVPTQRGFVRGNMLPLVPLCELQQGNTCGIDDAWLAQRKEYAERAIAQAVAGAQKGVDAKMAAVAAEHAQAVASYERITGKQAPAWAAPNDDAGAVAKCMVTKGWTREQCLSAEDMSRGALPQAATTQTQPTAAPGPYIAPPVWCAQHLDGGQTNPNYAACVASRTQQEVGQ